MNQYPIVFSDCLNAAQKADLWELLVLTDHEFVPALSERSSTTQANFDTLEEKSRQLPAVYYENLLHQHFLLALDGTRMIGFMSYIPDFELTLEDGSRLTADYVSTVIVHPDYRSNGITEALYRFLTARKKTGCIATRTWSTNAAHLRILGKMGFQNIFTIPNGRGEGIDTVYYCKNI